jgi:hypothetical protein
MKILEQSYEALARGREEVRAPKSPVIRPRWRRACNQTMPADLQQRMQDRLVKAMKKLE